MVVTPRQFRRYLHVFHETLESTARKYLPAEELRRLRHLSVLPARIVGYVSTELGVAFEYINNDKTVIEVVSGKDRVEDLLVRAPHHSARGHVIMEIGRNNGIEHVTLGGSFPFRMAGSDSSLTLTEVGFKIDEWRRVVQYAEVYGDNSRDAWTSEAAIARAKDEILAASIEIKRAKEKHVSLSKYVEDYKKNTVLILGSYSSDGMKRLTKIATKLEEYGYLPLWIKDITDHPHQDLSQKVSVPAGISRFVVIDDTESSGHIAELEQCKKNDVLMIILRAHGQGASYMTAGSSLTSTVILELDYDPESPHKAIHQGIMWAEGKLNEREGQLKDLYPWRQPRPGELDEDK